MKKNITLSENYTRTTAEIINEINAIIESGENISAEKLLKLESDANSAAKYENELAVKAHINALLDMERVKMFTSLIDNPFVPGVIRVTKNAKTAAFEIVDGKRQLGFSELEYAYQLKNSKENNSNGNPIANKSVSLAKDARYTVLLSLFVDNIARSISNDIEATCPQLNKANIASRATEIDFKAYTTTALVAQLNAIVSYILPEEISVKMINCDVKAIKLAAAPEKFMVFSLKNETRMLNSIFMAIGIRKSGKAYSFQSKANCHKADKVVKSKK